MRVAKTATDDKRQRQEERLDKLRRVPKFPLWLKILAWLGGFLFVWLFVTWAIWAMQTVVIPRLQR